MKPFKIPANTSTALPTPPLSGPDSVEPPERAQEETLKTSGNEEDEVPEKLEEGDDAEEDEDEERSSPARHSLPPEDASSDDDDDAIIVHKRPFRQHTSVEHTAASSSHSSTPTDNHESISIPSASRPISHAHSRATRSRTRASSRPSKHVRFLRVEVPTWKAIQQERVREARLRRQAARSRSLRSSRSASASVDRGFSGDSTHAPPASTQPQDAPTEPILPAPEHEHEQQLNAEEHDQQSDSYSPAHSDEEHDLEHEREEERQSALLPGHGTEDAAIGAFCLM